MSVEVWQGDKCLGTASERIVEYIDNLERRAAVADELAAALIRYMRAEGVMYDREATFNAIDVLARYDATKETP